MSSKDTARRIYCSKYFSSARPPLTRFLLSYSFLDSCLLDAYFLSQRSNQNTSHQHRDRSIFLWYCPARSSQTDLVLAFPGAKKCSTKGVVRHSILTKRFLFNEDQKSKSEFYNCDHTALLSLILLSSLTLRSLSHNHYYHSHRYRSVPRSCSEVVLRGGVPG